jgi:hypothetical protein
MRELVQLTGNALLVVLFLLALLQSSWLRGCRKTHHSFPTGEIIALVSDNIVPPVSATSPCPTPLSPRSLAAEPWLLSPCCCQIPLHIQVLQTILRHTARTLLTSVDVQQFKHTALDKGMARNFIRSQLLGLALT